MRIKSLTLSNFRCFGPKPTTIKFSELTCFVGTNGSGKSAVLAALARMFGTSADERTLERSDFHVPSTTKATETVEISLFLEVRLEFPEIQDNGKNPSPAIPECFNQMIVDEPGKAPYCRLRLEGCWKASNTPEGEIETSSYWITTSGTDIEQHKKQVSPYERSRIHVLYVPAVRDPSSQLRYGRGYLLSRVLRAVNWSPEISTAILSSAAGITAAFDGQAAVRQITKAIRANWKSLHSLTNYGEPTIRPFGSELDQILRNIQVVFAPTPHGVEQPVEKLSEGLKSLFYLALIGTNFDIENELLKLSSTTTQEEIDKAPISLERMSPPSLFVLAFEEPENHLAPHYLGRITSTLRGIAGSSRGQVLLTSHSPSIMTRIEPEEVRYLRLDPAGESTVRNISLPPEAEDSHKYVKEAIKAYPELYFSTLVVLGEGASEEIVVPRISYSMGLPTDINFVSIVPLGGRHVNYFWKLLSDLKIPHLTLLDLDWERQGGGWGRIKYVCKELLRIGVKRETLLTVADGPSKTRVLTEAELDSMHEWELEVKMIEAWTNSLEKHDVFFSSPLDIDFLMFRQFPAAYEATAKGAKGPAIPAAATTDYDSRMKAVVSAVLGSASEGVTYSKAERESFFWYRYLFLNRSKPSTHIEALATLGAADLRDNAPDVLKRMVKKMKKKLDSVTAT